MGIDSSTSHGSIFTRQNEALQEWNAIAPICTLLEQCKLSSIRLSGPLNTTLKMTNCLLYDISGGVLILKILKWSCCSYHVSTMHSHIPEEQRSNGETQLAAHSVSLVHQDCVAVHFKYCFAGSTYCAGANREGKTL